MASSRKSKKPRRPSKASLAKLVEADKRQTELWGTTLRRNRFAMMLRNTDKWLRFAEVYQQADPDELLARMIKEKRRLDKQIEKLRTPSPNPPPQAFESHPVDIESVKQMEYVLEHFRHRFFDDRDLRVIEGPSVSVGEVLPPRLYKCEDQSLVAVPSSPVPTDPDPWRAPDTDVAQHFSTFSELRSGDWVGVAFRGFYLDVGDSDVWIDDFFEARTTLHCRFFPAPCDGKIRYWYDGRMIWSPAINADAGDIECSILTLLHTEGDGRDVWVDPETRERSFFFSNAGTYQSTRQYLLSEPDANEFEVVSNQREVLDVGVKVRMYVGGGRTSFSWIGWNPVGEFYFRKHPAATVPGVLYTFNRD